MLFKSVFITALGAFSVSANIAAADEGGRFDCGTQPPSAEHRGMSKLLAFQESKTGASSNVTARATININVYFHVLAGEPELSQGYITEPMINDQLAVMNADFAPYGIAFTLVSTDYTIDPGWAYDSNEMDMKRKLRKGTYSDLNIYSQARLVFKAFGYASFPLPVTPGSDEFIRDGVTINAQTLPGGSYSRFNLGKTAVHEIGHWLGLYHTFQDGCEGGDGVDDTPAQESGSEECPIGRDSCPDMPGLDPIHNYMDYSDDACYEEFTPGQVARMLSFWNALRA